ncbi:endonuclease V [Geodermatophilus sp. SYSU D00697]
MTGHRVGAAHDLASPPRSAAAVTLPVADGPGLAPRSRAGAAAGPHRPDRPSSGGPAAGLSGAPGSRRAGPGARWPAGPEAATAEQWRLGALRPPAWTPGASPPLVAAAAAVSAAQGERCWAAAVLVRGTQVLAARTVEGSPAARYVPTLLVLREGPLLARAVDELGAFPDVLLLAATGRDHPRRAGLALHLGAVLDLPTVGVTDVPLLARGPGPGPRRGDTAALLLDGREVARWVRTATGVRPLVAAAAWRTTAATAADVVLATSTGVRTPQPLREARRLAREARARAVR